MGLSPAHLVGHSFAGAEMTQFATSHPDRVISLVYLDVALDLARAEAVMKDAPIPRPQPQPATPYSQVLAWSSSYSPDFTLLRSPALAFYALQDESPGIPPDTSENLSPRVEEYWRNRWVPMVR